jgi:DNA-binding IclR family transcriptional regulator
MAQRNLTRATRAPPRLRSRQGGAREPADRLGIQSIEVGVRLLDVLAAASGPMTLRDLGIAAEMSSSKARRYLVSLIKCGMVEQDATTNRYDLGEMSLRVGLATLNRSSVVREATLATIELSRVTDETVALSVWGEHGPTIISWYDSSNVVICNLSVGSVLPLLRTATGRVFLAFLPRGVTQPLIDRELAADARVARIGIKSEADIDRAVAQVRRRRLGVTRGDFLPGLSAVAAPIFDSQGRLVASLAMLGIQGRLENLEPSSPVAQLKKTAETVSRKLGFTRAGVGASFIEWRESADGEADPRDPLPPALAG